LKITLSLRGRGCLGRSVKDLVALINELRERGVEFVSLTEAIDTTTPMGSFIFHITAALAELANVRSSGSAPPLARAYACDAGDPATVERTFEAIESDLGSVDWSSAEEVIFEDFEAAWRTNTFGAFAAARSVIPGMKRRAAGPVIFVGATASRRGGAKTWHLLRPRRLSAVWPNPSPVRSGHRRSMSR
jgi:NAD(P)-dependent dehydrogenase (short-subunit alcohol dehydrogenase family)